MRVFRPAWVRSAGLLGPLRKARPTWRESRSWLDPEHRCLAAGWAGGVVFDEHVQESVGALPHVADAWIDHTKTKIGYEIPFTRHFYVYKPPRPLAEIDAELKSLEAEIQTLLGEVAQ